MTDNEITIKALKELLEVMLIEGDLKRTSTISHTINFINSKNAEIERLRACVKSEDEVRAIMKSQMMPMVSEIVNEQFDVAVKLAKAKAIKEFAERLSSDFSLSGGYFTLGTVHYKIDNLVKEMVGDDNA